MKVVRCCDLLMGVAGSLLILCALVRANSISDTMQAIDRATAGTPYSCKTVSWEDAQRAVVDGSLSALGPNIADVRLWEKSGRLLYTVRSDNWNERLAYVKPRDL